MILVITACINLRIRFSIPPLSQSHDRVKGRAVRIVADRDPTSSLLSPAPTHFCTLLYVFICMIQYVCNVFIHSATVYVCDLYTCVFVSCSDVSPGSRVLVLAGDRDSSFAKNTSTAFGSRSKILVIINSLMTSLPKRQ